MPVCLALENARRLNDLSVIQSATNKLYARRQAVLAETARHADCRQAADVADAANGIGKGQRFVQVGIELAGGHRQGGSRQNVNVLENFVHLYLQNGANTLGQNEV